MLKYQGYKQFKYFTGVDYESNKSEWTKSSCC
jgi:hypothetical protein